MEALNTPQHRKTVLILRAVSGSGKSFLTDLLCKNEGYVYVSADDYFLDSEGNYNFKGEEVGLAHGRCKDNFLKALEDPEAQNIIVSNTNTKPTDFCWYDEMARAKGANVIYLVLENRHGGVNVHDVPEETLQRQEQNIKSSLKLR